MSDDNTQSDSPFAGRGFIAAAIVVGVIVLAGVIVLVTALTAPKDDPVAQPTNTGGPVASGDDQSVCGLEGFEEESSLTDAPDVEWELVGTVAAPFALEVGPGVTDDGFRRCFEHTAEGALFAAVNFIALGTDATTGPRLVELVAPGPGRDALEAQASEGGPSSLRAQVAGFAISNYTKDSVTVDLALNYSSGDLVSLPLKLVWAEGDWKVQMTDTGQLPIAPGAIASLGGYIPWSGA